MPPKTDQHEFALNDKRHPGKPNARMEHTQAAHTDKPNLLSDSADMQGLLSAFGEATLVIGRDRRVSSALGDCDNYFSRPPSTCIGLGWKDLILDCAASDHKASLYWAVEALIEG